MWFLPTTCEYDPKALAGAPFGMIHCPVCGDMVLAGAPHPDRLVAEGTEGAYFVEDPDYDYNEDEDEDEYNDDDIEPQS